jgi:UDP-N-acetylenolpyruvoylglucosamine reductase
MRVKSRAAGAARQFRELVAELKARVRERFGLELQEEAQYLGFGGSAI